MRKLKAVSIVSLIFLVLILSQFPPSFGTSTIGNTSTGSTSYPTTTQTINDCSGNPNGDTASYNTVYYVAITIGASGAISEIGVDVTSYNFYSGIHIVVGLYNDSSGTPNYLLGSSSSATLYVGWNDITLSSGISVTGSTQYWMSFRIDGTLNLCFKSINYNLYHLTGLQGGVSWSDSWPDPANIDNGWIGDGWYTRITYTPIYGFVKGYRYQYSGQDWNGLATTFYLYTHGSGSYKFGVYSDSSGSPGSLLWYSGSTSASTSTWNSISESSGTLAGGWNATFILNSYYWFMWQWSTIAIGPSYTSGSSGQGIYLIQSYGSFPSTWSGGTATGEQWSQYASFSLTNGYSLSNSGSIAIDTAGTGSGSGSNTISVTNIAGSHSVSLSCETPPLGVSCGFSPSSGTASFSSTLTVTVSSWMGTAVITVDGTEGSNLQTTSFTLISSLGETGYEPYRFANFVAGDNYTFVVLYSDSSGNLKFDYNKATDGSLVGTITVFSSANWYSALGASLTGISNMRGDSGKDHFAVVCYNSAGTAVQVAQYNITFTGTTPSGYQAGSTVTKNLVYPSVLTELSAYLQTNGNLFVGNTQWTGSAWVPYMLYFGAQTIQYNNSGDSGSSSSSMSSSYSIPLILQFRETNGYLWAVLGINSAWNVTWTSTMTKLYEKTTALDFAGSSFETYFTIELTDTIGSLTPLTVWPNFYFGTLLIASGLSNSILVRRATINTSGVSWSNVSLSYPTGFGALTDMTISGTDGLDYLTITDGTMVYTLQSSNEFQSFRTTFVATGTFQRVSASQEVFPVGLFSYGQAGQFWNVRWVASTNTRTNSLNHPWITDVQFTAAAATVTISTVTGGTFTVTYSNPSMTVTNTQTAIVNASSTSDFSTWLIAGLFVLLPAGIVLARERSALAILVGLTSGLVLLAGSMIMGIVGLVLLALMVMLMIVAVFFRIRGSGGE